MRHQDCRDNGSRYYTDLEDICALKAFLLYQEGHSPESIEAMMEVYGPAQMALRG